MEKKNNSFSERQSFTISPHSKSSKTVLKVTFPDGKIISHRFAYETLVDTIKTLGFEKVKSLNITCCGVPLVATGKDDFYSQHELSKGIYIMTHSATRSKKEQILTFSLMKRYLLVLYIFPLIYRFNLFCYLKGINSCANYCYWDPVYFYNRER